MPNRNEMQSMSDRIQTNESQYFDYTILNLNNTVYEPAILANFVISQFYRTSTTDAANPTEGWTVYSCDFGVYDQPKANTGYTLAVRQVPAKQENAIRVISLGRNYSRLGSPCVCG